MKAKLSYCDTEIIMLSFTKFNNGFYFVI